MRIKQPTQFSQAAQKWRCHFDRGGNAKYWWVVWIVSCPSHIAITDRSTSDWSRCEAELTGKKSSVPPEKASSPTDASVRHAEWLAKALLLIQDHADWSDRQIAQKVGIDHSQLSRSRVYQVAKSMALGKKADRPKGHVKVDPTTKQRDIEAYSDADDPAKKDWDN